MTRNTDIAVDLDRRFNQVHSADLEAGPETGFSVRRPGPNRPFSGAGAAHPSNADDPVIRGSERNLDIFVRQMA